ncbi:MAG: hypothetical protein HFE84_03210 [Lachnospiraceae bacterium]|nr:hypothetical protein [Lachnospiraceae bacterium]
MEGQYQIVLWFFAVLAVFIVGGCLLLKLRRAVYLNPVRREMKKERQWLRRGEYNAAMVKGRQNLEMLLNLVAGMNGIQLDNTAQAVANAKSAQNAYGGGNRGRKKKNIMTYQQFGWWLDEKGYLDRVAKWELNQIRLLGNKAVHENYSSKEEAWNQYRYLEDLLKVLSDWNPSHQKRKQARGTQTERTPAQKPGKKENRAKTQPAAKKKQGQKIKGQQAEKKQEDGKKRAEIRKQEEARKQAEARKQEEARKQAEAKRQAETAKKQEEARKQAEAKKQAEAAKKQEEAKKQAEAARKQEEARRQAEAKKQAEAAKRQEEARKQEEAKKQAEAARKQEEARRQAEAKKQAEAAKRQEKAGGQSEEAKRLGTEEQAVLPAQEREEVPIPSRLKECSEKKTGRRRRRHGRRKSGQAVLQAPADPAAMLEGRKDKKVCEALLPQTAQEDVQAGSSPIKKKRRRRRKKTASPVKTAQVETAALHPVMVQADKEPEKQTQKDAKAGTQAAKLKGQSAKKKRRRRRRPEKSTDTAKKQASQEQVQAPA